MVRRKTLNPEYFQSAVFGVNDALVSTTGVIVGISAGTGDKHIILLAGVVTILVEALSMGSGQYLSAKSAHQYKRQPSLRVPVISGIIMFFGYIMGGLIPLLPILFFSVETSRTVTIISALLGLFLLGLIKGKIARVSPLRSAVEIIIIGGLATMIGLLVGNFLQV